MKKHLKIYGIVLMLFISVISQAQIGFGVRGGLNLANMYGAGFDQVDPKIRPSFMLGGFIDYSVSKTFTMETGLFISGKGTKFKAKIGKSIPTNGVYPSMIIYDGELSYAPIYLELPINALYSFRIGDSKLLVFGGPYISCGVGGKIKEEYSESGKTVTNDIELKYGSEGQMKRIDSGINIGAGFEYKKIQLRIQYALGITNLDEHSRQESAMKNKVIGLSIGYVLR